MTNALKTTFTFVTGLACKIGLRYYAVTEAMRRIDGDLNMRFAKLILSAAEIWQNTEWETIAACSRGSAVGAFARTLLECFRYEQKYEQWFNARWQKITVDIRCLQKGDHIAVFRGLYYHHAIYLGNGMIAEIGGSSKSLCKPRTTTIDSFRKKAKYIIRIDYTYLESAEVVQRALEVINNPKTWGCYNLINNNCEHFATYCKTGLRWSPQGDTDVFCIIPSINDVCDEARLSYRSFCNNIMY
ncbi:hypothetical protein DPMN_042896 [Dreissena polymorpha]|uniref:LRAT domain-containing protein n=1 Tax=Dreissena polymorpha TaxID=45954 RepID=A0A9D4CZG4_DREPO|nr:hypothetical protein DPMN_042896 [Dreissena polymorpha]